MPTAEENVYSTLTGFAGLQALINNGDSPQTFRVYPYEMPQDPTFPAVVYQRIVGTRIQTLSDAGGSGVERVVIQVSAWATTLNEVSDVMEQVRLALKAASYEVVPLDNRASYEPDTKLFGFQYDFAVWHR